MSTLQSLFQSFSSTARPFLLASLLGSIAGCSFVETLPGSETVVLSNSVGDNCQRLGEVEVKVLDEIIGIDRNQETMADELATLARNAAFKKGGNTITPDTEISEGQQTFSIYRCR